MNRKMMKKLIVMLLALCLTALPVMAGLADEVAAESGETQTQAASEEKEQQAEEKKEEKKEEPKKEEKKEEPKQEEEKKEEKKEEPKQEPEASKQDSEPEPPKQDSEPEPPKQDSEPEPPKQDSEPEPPKQDDQKPEESDPGDSSQGETDPGDANPDEQQGEPNPDDTNPGDQPQGGQDQEPEGDGETQPPEQDTQTPAPENSPAPSESTEPTATPEASAEATPPVMMMSAELMPIAANIENGVYTVSKSMTVAEVLKEITEAGAQSTVTKIKINSSCTLSGSNEDTVTYAVENRGTISSGKYTGEVTNSGKITGGTFTQAVTNSKGTISGGTFEGAVTSKVTGSTISGGAFKGEVTNEKFSKITDGTFDAKVTNTGSAEIRGGTFNGEVINEATILGGTYNKSLDNYGVVNQVSSSSRPLINGTFIVEDDSTAQYCNFGKTTDEYTIKKMGSGTGTITILFTHNGTSWWVPHGSNVISVLNNQFADEKKQADEKAKWYSYKYDSEDASVMKEVQSGDTFNLPQRVYVLALGEDFVVDKNMTVKELNEELAKGTYEEIIIKEKVTLSGENGDALNPSLPVLNYGTISGGVYSGKVTNQTGGTISGGTYSGAVTNVSSGKITGGTYSGTVTNVKGGTISGGTYNATLDNFGTVQGAKLNGEFIAEEDGTFKSCTFGSKAKATKKKASATGKKDGSIEVKYNYKTYNKDTKKYNSKSADQTAEYDTAVLTALNKVKSAQWYYKSGKKNVNVDTKTLFGLEKRTYIEVTPKPTETKNTGSNGSPSNGGSSGSSSSDNKATSSPTPKPTAKNYSEDDADGSDTEESTVGAREELVEDYLKDGESSDVSIVQDPAVSAGADYELIAVVPEDPTQEANLPEGDLDLDSLDSVSNYSWDDDDTDAEAATEATGADDADAAATEADESLLPGEVGEDGIVPGMLYVHAKGNGSQTRRLTLTLSQLRRMEEEQEIEVLLFRNGATTMSLDVSQLFEGNVPKLMQLMQTWRQNGVDFAENDIDTIDFDAIQLNGEADDEAEAETDEAAVEEIVEETLEEDSAEVSEEDAEADEEELPFTEEQLREYKLQLTIAPATPVGYTIQVELRLGEGAVDIGGLLEKMGVTLHTDPVEQEVAVYHMDAEQQRHRLETHRGSVPGVKDRVEGYEVSFANSISTVTALDRSVTDGEFGGYCAFSDGAGTYYIGVLPTATATPEAPTV